MNDKAWKKISDFKKTLPKLKHLSDDELNKAGKDVINTFLVSGCDIFQVKYTDDLRVRIVMIPSEQELLYLPETEKEQIIYLENILKTIRSNCLQVSDQTETLQQCR
jgi:hypothetical protein